MNMTDKVYNNRDERIVSFINDNRDDVERILRHNFDFYRGEHVRNAVSRITTVGIYAAPFVILILLSCAIYALVK